MTKTRRLCTFIRGRRLVAVALFGFVTYLFANNLTPTPQDQVQTDGKFDQDKLARWYGPSFRASTEHVSNDGSEVVIAIHEGDHRHPSVRLQLWDMRSRMNRTPAHWTTREWQELSRFGGWSRGNGPVESLRTERGKRFLADEAAWSIVRERFALARIKHVENEQRAGRRVRDDERTASPFPRSLQFSPCGSYISYSILDGSPVNLVSDDMADATVIETVRTGERIAELPDETRSVEIAPGGRTAVSQGLARTRSSDVFDVYETNDDLPQFWLWDLKLSRVRAILWAPGDFHVIGFSPDGHFVFAGGPRSDLLRWWDTETGFLVGEVDDVALPMFLDGGKTIALQFRNDSVLHFWDVASGIEIGKWEPMNPVGNNVLEFSACGSDRYLVTEFDSTLGKSNTPSTQLTDKVVDWLSNRLQYDSTSDERRRILIIDAIDHRELGHVPGLSAMISENGRWLATIDANGVVRVWELPLRRPWLKSCRNAALVVFGGWFALALLAKLRRRIGRAGDYVRTEGPQYGDTSATSNM